MILTSFIITRSHFKVNNMYLYAYFNIFSRNYSIQYISNSIFVMIDLLMIKLNLKFEKERTLKIFC